ncbi:ABC transporter permease [Bosea thiooxidans]|nr:ABC transporter permease [Bosea sp. (in: a-proteobacteria)]
MNVARHLRRLWLYVIAALVALFLVAPIALIVPMSFSASEFLTFPPPGWSLRWYQAYLGSVEWQRATWVSLRIALCTMVLATIIGALTSYGLHRGRLRLNGAIFGIILLPAVVPAVLIAVGAFVLFARVGLNNTFTGLILAHTALALPFVVLLIGSAMRQYDWDLDRAARSLGASPLRAFIDVVFPQMKFSFLSGALVAFLTSFDEVVISIFISSGDRATLTKKMFTALRNDIDPVIAAIATLLIGFSVVVMVLSIVAARGRDARASG